MIQQLEKQFTGIGEVSKFQFKQLESSKLAYIYEVSTQGTKHYEVFLNKTTEVCIDFDKKIYSKTDLKVRYPKSRDFGTWAWTYKSLEKAMEKFAKANEPVTE